MSNLHFTGLVEMRKEIEPCQQSTSSPRPVSTYMCAPRWPRCMYLAYQYCNRGNRRTPKSPLALFSPELRTPVPWTRVLFCLTLPLYLPDFALLYESRPVLLPRAVPTNHPLFINSLKIVIKFKFLWDHSDKSFRV